MLINGYGQHDFFRTRSLAKEAIEAGKVHMNGAKIKVSKELQVGDTLTIRQGHATRLEEKNNHHQSPI